MPVFRAVLCMALLAILGAFPGCQKSPRQSDSAAVDTAAVNAAESLVQMPTDSPRDPSPSRVIPDSAVLAIVFGSLGVRPVAGDRAVDHGEYRDERVASWHVHWAPDADACRQMECDKDDSLGRVFSCVVACDTFMRRDSTLAAVLLENLVWPASGCHACPAYAAVALLARSDTGWVCVAWPEHSGAVGSYGGIPGEATLQRLGFDNVAFTMELSGGGQGYNYTSLMVINLPPDPPGVFCTELGGDNEGTCGDSSDGMPPCWSYSSTWEFFQRPNNDGHDLRTATEGTNGGGELGTRPISRSRTYLWNGATYVLDGGE